MVEQGHSSKGYRPAAPGASPAPRHSSTGAKVWKGQGHPYLEGEVHQIMFTARQRPSGRPMAHLFPLPSLFLHSGLVFTP